MSKTNQLHLTDDRPLFTISASTPVYHIERTEHQAHAGGALLRSLALNADPRCTGVVVQRPERGTSSWTVTSTWPDDAHVAERTTAVDETTFVRRVRKP